MRRGARVCVDCGGQKSKNAHLMAQRCDECRKAFYAAMLKAQAAIATAKNRGDVAPAVGQQCVDCSAPATDLDHRDYSKPLDVQPVCRSCNFKRGPALYPRAYHAEPQQAAA